MCGCVVAGDAAPTTYNSSAHHPSHSGHQQHTLLLTLSHSRRGMLHMYNHVPVCLIEVCGCVQAMQLQQHTTVPPTPRIPAYVHVPVCLIEVSTCLGNKSFFNKQSFHGMFFNNTLFLLWYQKIGNVNTPRNVWLLLQFEKQKDSQSDANGTTAHVFKFFHFES